MLGRLALCLLLAAGAAQPAAPPAAHEKFLEGIARGLLSVPKETVTLTEQRTLTLTSTHTASFFETAVSYTVRTLSSSTVSTRTHAATAHTTLTRHATSHETDVRTATEEVLVRATHTTVILQTVQLQVVVRTLELPALTTPVTITVALPTTARTTDVHTVLLTEQQARTTVVTEHDVRRFTELLTATLDTTLTVQEAVRPTAWYGPARAQPGFRPRVAYGHQGGLRGHRRP